MPSPEKGPSISKPTMGERELADLDARLAELSPPAPPRPAAPAAEVHQAPGPDAGAAAGADFDATLEKAIKDGGRKLTLPELSEEFLGEFAELGFSTMGDFRGRHWDLPDASKRRIGKWLKINYDRLTDVPEWLMPWLPVIGLVVAVGSPLRERLKIDREKRKLAKAENGEVVE